ncbi:MAG: RNA methyltransferase [Eubacterium sp.]|nr:RNA methyltransferase [Eubacterium sp.]
MITSASNERVKKLNALRTKAKARRERGVFIAEGVKMLKEAPEEALREIYVSESFSEKDYAQRKAQESGAQYEVLSDAVFAKVSDTVTPQGVICVLARREATFEEITSANSPFLILLEDVRDPGNLGTIVRTAEGAGVTGIVASTGTADLYNPKVVRSTMGSIYRVPYLTTDDFCYTVNTLKGMGIKTFAAALEGSSEYTRADYTGGCAILIGNESAGLSADAVAAAEYPIRIPMDGDVESLNASVAAAVIMYEARRQRKAGN